MSAKPVKLLSLITVIAVLLAVAVLLMNRGPAPLEGTGDLFFPALADHLNEAARIEMAAGEDTVTLVRAGDIWQVAEKAGYPADQEKARAFLLGLSRAEKVEPKTGNPDLYARVGLGAEALTLAVLAEDGGSLARLDIGNSQYDGAARENRTFVLPDGETQTWLASGLAETQPEPVEWLDKNILTLERKRIAGVALSHEDGESFTISRDDPDSYNFSLEGLADGEGGKTSMLNSIAGAVQFLAFEDVARIEDMVFTDPMTAIVRTFDGLSVRLVVAGAGNDRWAWLTASYDPAAPEQADAPAVMQGAPEDGAQEAADLNQRWTGWAYKLPGLKADDLTRRRADLVDRPEEEMETE